MPGHCGADEVVRAARGDGLHCSSSHVAAGPGRSCTGCVRSSLRHAHGTRLAMAAALQPCTALLAIRLTEAMPLAAAGRCSPRGPGCPLPEPARGRRADRYATTPGPAGGDCETFVHGRAGPCPRIAV